MAGTENKINEELSEDISSGLKLKENNNVIIDVQESSQSSEPVEQTRGFNDNSSDKKKKSVCFFKQFLLPRVYISAIVFFVLYYILNIAYHVIFHIFIKGDINIDDDDDNESISSTSTNQQVLETSFAKNRSFLFVLFVSVIGPIIEEIIFRLCIFRPIQLLGQKVAKSNKFLGWIIILLAFVISSSIFAFAHYGFSFSLFIDEIESVPTYFIMGVVLALAYSYDGYLATSMITHIINNTLATLVMYLNVPGLIFNPF